VEQDTRKHQQQQEKTGNSKKNPETARKNRKGQENT
jgi:hypothetical protein